MNRVWRVEQLHEVHIAIGNVRIYMKEADFRKFMREANDVDEALELEAIASEQVAAAARAYGETVLAKEEL